MSTKLDAPLMGVREWCVYGFMGNPGTNLISTGRALPWSEGVQEAICAKRVNPERRKDGEPFWLPPEHKAPNYYCTCGLYAYYNRDSYMDHSEQQASNGGIAGVVSAWGKVFRREYGFRAQFMRLEAFIRMCPDMEYMGKRFDLSGAYQEMAERHDVPLIEEEEVSVFMALSGGTVLEPEGSFSPRGFLKQRGETWGK